MRVLIVNTSERVGGAAIAANRLMEALKHNGVKAKMLVRDVQTNHMTVMSVGNSWLLPFKFVWERLVIFLANGLSRKNLFQVDIANCGTDITSSPEFLAADVVHLHWVNQGYLSLDDIRKILISGKPVVVTMHDEWYFTGICHYSGECMRYTTECTDCPLLKNGGMGCDLARKVFRKKRRIYSEAKRGITFVGCSKWIAGMAEKSALTKGNRVVSIPNAINTNIFHPDDKKKARSAHDLPMDRKLLLFGSQRITDERKGFKYLAEACRLINEKNPELAQQLGIVVVGAHSAEVKDAIDLPVYAVDYVSSEAAMMELYNAVDLYVTPSLQDNLPNTIVEAMTCGVPCVGFAVGGIPEMIDHKKNGYVAQQCDAADFAEGMVWALDGSRYAGLCEDAHRKAVNTYSEDRVARKYLEIYEKALIIHNS